MNRTLAAELAAMAAQDQRIRQAPDDAVFEWRPSPEQLLEWARVDTANSDRMREIVAEHGWPGRSLVGEEGAEHAWLLVQHADHQLDLQRHALELLQEAVANGEATPTQLAYLTDRVRMNEGRPQVFGTQIAGMDEEGPLPWPVEDPDRLEERRAAAGLEPFAVYAQRFLQPSADASDSGTTVEA